MAVLAVGGFVLPAAVSAQTRPDHHGRPGSAARGHFRTEQRSAKEDFFKECHKEIIERHKENCKFHERFEG